MVDRYQVSCQRLFNQRYSHFIHQTPLWKLPGSALGIACAEVWLKLEHLQTGGSFKDAACSTACCRSQFGASGGQLASGKAGPCCNRQRGQVLGVPCEVYVPEISSAAKRARLAELGAQVVVGGPTYAGAARLPDASSKPVHC